MSQLHLQDEAAASMVEYAFLLAGIALVAAIAFPFFAERVSDLFDRPLPFFGP